jgi:hypothetical protein
VPTEASHGRSNGRVPDSVRLGIFSRREYRCRPGLHRPGCGGSTPPSHRVFFGLQTLIVKSRLLTGENTVRIRGDPPFRRCGSAATGACARPQRFARNAVAACQCLRRPHFIFEGRKRIEKFLRRSGVVRTARERLLSAIFLRPFAPVAQLSARRASNAEVAGEIPAGSTNSCPVSPTRRGVPLRTGRLKVQILHVVPTWWPCASSPRSPTQRQRT